jgi:hypothetical protein
MRWMDKATLRPLYPRKETDCTGCLSGLWPLWICAENLAPTGIRSLDRPAQNKSLPRLRYPCLSPKGSRALRLPDFQTAGSWRCRVVIPTHRPALPPRKYPRHSVRSCVEPRARVATKNSVNTIGNCSASTKCPIAFPQTYICRIDIYILWLTYFYFS